MLSLLEDFGFRRGKADLCRFHLTAVCRRKGAHWDVGVVPYLADGRLSSADPQPGCAPQYRLVCQGNDSEIEHVMARWAGCYEEWRASPGMRSRHFIRDVVEVCGVPVSVSQKRWDFGMPGMSGIWYKVSTTGKPELKQAVRARLAELVAQLSKP